jgi:hypothetical protein
MPVLFEKYILPILATVTVLVLVTNPMNFGVRTRIGSLILVLTIAVGVSYSIHRHNTKNAHATSPAVNSTSLMPSPIASGSNLQTRSNKADDAGGPLLPGKPTFTRPTPSEIREEINQRPPYEQDHAAESYVGLPVCWAVQFHSLRREKGDLYDVIFLSSGHGTVLVGCKLSISEYPHLKIARQGENIEVTGIIKSVGRIADIVLGDAKIGFPDR